MIGILALAACARTATEAPSTAPTRKATSRDPRVGLRAGWMDAAEAIAGLRVVSRTPPSSQFMNPSQPGDFRFINSDISFVGQYAVQGNFSGVQVWDISNPAQPKLHRAHVCPGSQSDVSVYRNLLFVSGEALDGRTDCGTEGVHDTVSHDRLRGIRIFEISDIANPKYLTNVQTCRGSHTHSVVTDPDDTANVYIYVSGAAPVRSPNELAGCSDAPLDQDPNTALFRIEVIQVPLAAPERAKIVNRPRIFSGLTEPASHGEAAEDIAAAGREAAAARARGGFTATVNGMEHVVPEWFVR
ncbi:MAG: LVIVD repeat-containing protein, partial [Acidimicrobiales bacterium]